MTDMMKIKSLDGTEPSYRIVVLDNGFVFMGHFHPAKEGKPAYITQALNLRVWGTTKGLGEIALGGPTGKTVMDDYGVVVLDNPEAVLFTIPCANVYSK